jgi:hypothetical protein
LTVAYDDITHCIYCDRKDFENFEQVLKHVKAEHDEKDKDEGKKWGNLDD